VLEKAPLRSKIVLSAVKMPRLPPAKFTSRLDLHAVSDQGGSHRIDHAAGATRPTRRSEENRYRPVEVDLRKMATASVNERDVSIESTGTKARRGASVSGRSCCTRADWNRRRARTTRADVHVGSPDELGERRACCGSLSPMRVELEVRDNKAGRGARQHERRSANPLVQDGVS